MLAIGTAYKSWRGHLTDCWRRRGAVGLTRACGGTGAWQTWSRLRGDAVGAASVALDDVFRRFDGHVGAEDGAEGGEFGAAEGLAGGGGDADGTAVSGRAGARG